MPQLHPPYGLRQHIGVNSSLSVADRYEAPAASSETARLGLDPTGLCQQGAGFRQK